MLPFGFLSFLAFGLALVLVGANQEHLARDLGIGLAESGLLTSALSLGLGVGVVGAGPLFDRYPRKPLFAGSMLLAAAALCSVERDMGFARWLVHLAVVGVGIGAYDTLLNAAVVERFGKDSARPMSLLHAAATLGAVTGPPLAGLLASEGHWIQSFHGAGAAHAVLGIAALAIPMPAPEALARSSESSQRISTALLPFAAIAFAYVGIEASLTVFAVPYASHLGLGATRGQLGISAVWLGLLAGRVGVLALRRSLDARVLTLAGAAGATALALGTFAPGGQIEITFFAAGVALGCVYPLMIALAGQALPHARGTAAGLAAGAGALGGFTIPWLAGALGDALSASLAIASMAGWAALIAFAAHFSTRAERAG